jgi:hypothetical protein
LDRVNVSLDTLDPERFAVITRRKRHADVLAALDAATAVGLRPVKINAVLLRGINDDEPCRCCASPSLTATTCASSNRCRWTPAIDGAGTPWSPPRRSWPRSPPSSN